MSALAVAVILVLVSLIFIGLGWIAKQLSTVLLPLAVAGIIAYLLDPVVDFFQRRRIPRTWAILLVFFLAVLLQAGVVQSVAPLLLQDARALKNDWPGYKDKLQKKLNDFLAKSPLGNLFEKFQLPESIKQFLPSDSKTSETTSAEAVDQSPDGKISIDGDLIEKAWSVAGPMLSQAGQWLVDSVGQIGSWLRLLVGFALVPVYVFYFLTEKKGIRDTWTDYLPIRESKMKEEIVFVLRSINDSLIVFFRSQVLVAICVGLLLMVGFSIIKLQYGVLLGFVAGALSIVPYLGVMLSIVPALTISIIQSSGIWGIWHPILTLTVFIVVQLIEGFFISPMIIGNRVGLHPLTIIIAIMIGTTLFGDLTGGVLAIPLTAALRTLMFRYVWKRRDWNAPHQAIPKTQSPIEPKH